MNLYKVNHLRFYLNIINYTQNIELFIKHKNDQISIINYQQYQVNT